MEAKVLGAHLLQLFEALGELRAGEAVLGVPRLIHDLEALLAFPQGKGAAGIVAAGDGLRNVPDGFLQKIDVGKIVQVDGGAQLVGQHELLGGGVVGGEHDLTAPKTAPVREHQLGEGGAVHPAALLAQEL